MFACISCHGIMLDGAVFHFPILAEDVVQDLLGDVDTIRMGNKTHKNFDQAIAVRGNRTIIGIFRDVQTEFTTHEFLAFQLCHGFSRLRFFHLNKTILKILASFASSNDGRPNGPKR